MIEIMQSNIAEESVDSRRSPVPLLTAWSYRREFAINIRFIHNWRRLLLIIAMLFAGSRVVAADEALDDYNVAVGQFKQSRWNQAADQFRKFLKTYDKHEKAPLARLYLGLTLVETKNFKGAREELRKFASENRQNPNIGQARYRIGECSYLLDDLPAARTELESFIRDFPDDPLREHAYPYLGDTQLRSNDAAAALKTFDLAIDKFPNGSLIEDAKFGRARSLESLKQYDDAITQYQALATNKESSRGADAQFHLGALYFEREQYDESGAAYAAIAKDFPQSTLAPAAQLNAGYALFKSGKFEEAARQFEQAASVPTQQPMASYWQGRSLKSMGDYAGALDQLKKASEYASKHTLAESILFEQALCERYLQHPAEARKLFEEVISKFPKGDLADDSAHALIESAIDAGDLAYAEQKLVTFPKDYPQSGLRYHVEMLAGRADLARAGLKLREKRPASELTPFYEAAAKRFEQVMRESTLPKTKGQSRYYLALTRQLQGHPDQAIELVKPLVERAVTDGEKSDFLDAIVLESDCFYLLQQYDQANQSAAKYLDLAPKGRQGARALSIQALSLERLNQTEASQAAIKRLTDEFPNHPLTIATFQQLAELAETRADWATVEKMYDAILKLPTDSDKKVYALRGIALSRYEREEYAAAAEAFGQLIKDNPQHSIVMECTYYQAESLKRADQPDAAIVLFKQIFDSFPGDKPAATGAEAQPPFEFSYKAGLQVARIYNKEEKLDEADAAYGELLRRFPKPLDLDKRLDEWAIFNYRHKRYERADSIWRRLVSEVPDSPLVNSARLSLAESDLFANRFDEARQVFEELADSDKSSDEVKEQSLYQLVALAVERQRWPDVRAIGNRLVTKFPNSVHRYYVVYSQAEAILASIKPSEQDLSSGREKLNALTSEANNEAVKDAEWFDRVWVLLAELNFREKKYADVITVIDDLKQRNPKSPFLYQAEEVLGRSYKQQAPPKFDDARAAFERALADPAAFRTETAAKAQFMIGETYFFEEKWDLASTAYQKVYSNYKFPEWQAAALLSSGKCDEAQNEWKLASGSYKLLLKEFPDATVAEEARKRLENAQKRAGAK